MKIMISQKELEEIVRDAIRVRLAFDEDILVSFQADGAKIRRALTVAVDTVPKRTTELKIQDT
jgi:hypothetical protein